MKTAMSHGPMMSTMKTIPKGQVLIRSRTATIARRPFISSGFIPPLLPPSAVCLLRSLWFHVFDRLFGLGHEARVIGVELRLRLLSAQALLLCRQHVSLNQREQD